MTTILALQQGIQKTLGVDKVVFDTRDGSFTCRCGQCGDMKVTGGTAQGLYETGELDRLAAVHSKRIHARAQRLAEFKKPSDQVCEWLVKEAKVDIRDLYRTKVLIRNENGGGEVMLWLFYRDKQGERYLDAKGNIARKSVKMTCQKLPEFFEDEYGYPLEKYEDDKTLTGV